MQELGTKDGTMVPEGSKYVSFKVGSAGSDPVETATLAAQEATYAIERNRPTGEGTVSVVLVRMDTFTDEDQWRNWLAAFKIGFPDAAVYKWYWEFHANEGLYDF